jgi:ketosteroid isomerase-like protein
MGAQDVELVRRCIQLWEDRNFEAMAELADPDFALDLSKNLDAEVYPGIDGLRRWTDRVGEMWDDFRIEPEELIDAGAHVVTCASVVGRGRESGIEAQMKVFQVWLTRQGKILRVIGGFRDRAEAMAQPGGSPS